MKGLFISEKYMPDDGSALIIKREQMSSIEKHDKEVGKVVAKEIFGEIIKSTALCESQGGHCSLDYLIVKARQYGLEYAGLDKDGNVIWVGDTINLN